jgi:hypothetical protein
VTISWDSATGVLKVFDNGRLVKTENDVLKGQAVAGDGHLVIGQKMNQPRSGGGWNANEHYSGQVFGTTLATHVYTDSEIAGAPLYSQSQGIVADLRNEGGALQDMTGRHTVAMQGNYSTTTQPVDTALALIPPGAEVRFGIRAAAGDSDSLLQSIELGGISGFNITDGVNSGTGTVDVTTWNLSAIRAQMPAGFKSNPSITLKVTAVEDGMTASAEDTKVLNMQPAAGSAAMTPADQLPTVVGEPDPTPVETTDVEISLTPDAAKPAATGSPVAGQVQPTAVLPQVQQPQNCQKDCRTRYPHGNGRAYRDCLANC